MKILSIAGIIISLFVIFNGYIVYIIQCYTGSGIGGSPGDAEGCGISIMASGIFFLIFSCIVLKSAKKS